ncbi:MAG: hypothetical protein ACOX4P_01470 [Anaerovoracaceae bacterium]|jgi:hypothetical protein
MDKRIMKFKLISYKQALRKAYEKNDKPKIKSWTKDIAELKKEIEKIK